MATLFRRDNGFYYIVYRDGDRRKWMSTHTRMREEADELFKSIKPSLELPRELRLQEFAQKIIRIAEVNYKKGTVDLYRISLRRFITHVGNKPLRFVSPIDAENFKAHLLQSVSKVSANVYLRTLKSTFNLGFRLNLVRQNPFKECKLLRVPQGEPVYIRKEEFARLLLAIPDYRFRELVIFAALTGMRRGEIVNLQWSDIDFDSKIIRIRNKDGFVVKGGRPRMIPISRDLYNMLQNNPRKSAFVFVDKHLRPYKGPSVTKKFKRAVRNCGLSEHIHFHSLRHSYASWLVQSATPLAEVQKLLGHTSIVTTQIYSHLGEDHLRVAAEKIRLDEFTPKALLI